MNIYEKCKEIEQQILELKVPNENILPIRDGIISIEKYLTAKYKILWILKESNDIENGEGGGWSLPEEILKKNWAEQSKYRGGRTAFRRISYCSYSILNNFISYHDLPNIDKSEDVFEAFKQTAYINIKKIPGGSVANEKLISQAYVENKELLFKQIDTYNPDIIIAGNTLHHFFNDLPIPFANKVSNGKTAYYPSVDKLYINAYHPAVRKKTIEEEYYCNDIILAAKDWAENWKK